MKKFFALCLVTSTLLGASSAVTLAKPPKAEKKVKVVDVWTCPMTGQAIKNKADKGVVYGAYRAHFCCADCPASFAKLPAKEQQEKLKTLAAKPTPATKKG